LSKSAEAFRTISEVAEELSVPKHVLRFWEQKFPQVKPMKRGGGRRYYRPEDLDLLRGIHHLLHHEGYTIRGVQKILRTQGLELVKSCWQTQSGPAPAVTVVKTEQPKAKPPKRGPTARPGSVHASALEPEVRRVVEAALKELEACRALLTPSTGGAAVVEGAVPRRTGR
jgi:DNA-binding transcriptional MerR regulator